MGVFAEIEGVVGAGQRGLEVAEHGVEPTEGLDFGTGLATRCDDRVMLMAQVLQDFEAEQPVGGDPAPRGQHSLRPAAHRRKGEVLHRLEARPHRAALMHLHGGDKGGLVLRITKK